MSEKSFITYCLLMLLLHSTRPQPPPRIASSIPLQMPPCEARRQPKEGARTTLCGSYPLTGA